jgi:hypothetical protein
MMLAIRYLTCSLSAILRETLIHVRGQPRNLSFCHKSLVNPGVLDRNEGIAEAAREGRRGGGGVAGREIYCKER